MDTFELGVVLTLKDYVSGRLGEIEGRWKNLRKSMDSTSASAQLFDRSMGMIQAGQRMLEFGSTGLYMSKSLIEAGLEAGKLEKNIESLGVSKEEVSKISSEVRGMTGDMGTAQETFLSGIYDIKSAISSLNPAELSSVAGALGKAALATKGDFAGLADLFGTTHAQFKKMYNESDAAFALRFANTLSLSVQKFKTDGAKMQAAMQGLGATAAGMGVKLEEQMAVLGMLQNTMLPGVAGTSYRAFLSSVGEGFQKLGLSAKNAQGQIKSMPELLEEMNKKYQNSFVVDQATGNKVLKLDARNEIKKALGSEEAVAALENLLPKMGELKTSISEIKDANLSGTAEALNKMASINQDNLSSQLDRSAEAWKSLKTSLSQDVSSGPILAIVKGFGDMLSGMTKFLDQSPGLRKFISYLVIGGSVALFLGGAFLTLVGVVGMYTAITSSAAAIKIFDTIATMKNWAAKVVNRTATIALAVAEYVLIGIVGGAIYAWKGLTFLYGVMTNRTKALAAWQTIQTGVTTGLTWASNALNVSLWSNPIGLAVAGILLAVGIVAAAVYYWDEWTSVVSNAWNEHKNLISALLLLTGPIGWTIAALVKIKDNWAAITGWIDKAVAAVKDFFGAGGSEVAVGATQDTVKVASPEQTNPSATKSIFDSMGMGSVEKMLTQTGGAKLDLSNQAQYAKALELPKFDDVNGLANSPLKGFPGGGGSHAIQITIKSLVDKVTFQNNASGYKEAGLFMGNLFETEMKKTAERGNPATPFNIGIGGM
ncbi:phage tail tape measure protein [Leptospira borgpetersenii]|uniref:Tail tape measure protein, TIGR01760 family n=2 Tax=Leptospira borgpetersenii TaxID=174 RepID=M3GXC6_LEPBO|nr:phage tail tape measure protein [Leptospira borgpetersenii]EKP13287.1 putative tail tape measure protein, TIGR01760 family [Leptospira borgpetersenii str. 200801926]EMF99488.1 tail tape measure protein, TIGR01760 family [Leptospira borgpetersenii str. 200701203]ENO65378.1 tail tape measure protein, TIGR01760 family [Leptospira borgpetersenii serovar Mini str. 201000851]